MPKIMSQNYTNNIQRIKTSGGYMRAPHECIFHAKVISAQCNRKEKQRRKAVQTKKISSSKCRSQSLRIESQRGSKNCRLEELCIDGPQSPASKYRREGVFLGIVCGPFFPLPNAETVCEMVDVCPVCVPDCRLI